MVPEAIKVTLPLGDLRRTGIVTTMTGATCAGACATCVGATRPASARRYGYGGCECQLSGRGRAGDRHCPRHAFDHRGVYPGCDG